MSFQVSASFVSVYGRFQNRGFFSPKDRMLLFFLSQCVLKSYYIPESG